MPTQDPIYYVEKVDIEDDEESIDFESIAGDDDLSDSDTEEDLETALRSMQQKVEGEPGSADRTADVPKATVSRRPEVVDDFIRNFLIRYKMTRTLDAFQREWYELQVRDCGPQNPELVPDCYVQNEELENSVKSLEREMRKMKRHVSKAGTQYIKMKKERDFHRMHHRRIVQEKEQLFTDIRRLKKHYQNYEPALEELKNKYETAMREKMLTKIECERNLSKVANLTSTLCNYEAVRTSAAGETLNKPIKELELEGGVQQDPTKVPASHPKDTVIPVESGVNPALSVTQPVSCHLTKPGGYRQVSVYKSHDLAVSNLAVHPFREVMATVSDDTTWKMWNIADGELLLTGRGHTMWVGGCDFHPDGTKLATGSGDTTVKVWDFAVGECLHTFTDHSHPVWGVAWHHSGSLLASCSMDNSSKLLDVESTRCRTTFRGHSDSVNSITFMPYSNILCTGSADKTISLWDIRTGLCAQTFYGHINAINRASFNLQGTTLASCDAYGVVKLWDVRAAMEISSYDFEPHPANYVSWDRSGACVAVSSNDCTVKMVDVEKGKVTELEGHEDGVNAALFARNGEMLVSASSDTTVRVWA